MEGLVTSAAAQFDGRRVLISGGTGFIGRRLSAALARTGAEVTVIDTRAPNDAHFQRQFSQIHFNLLDIRDTVALRQVFADSRPEYVFHLAAAGVTQPFLPLELALSVNLHGAINIFRASFESASLARPRVARLVHTGTPYERGGSTDQEIGPINPYAASKAAAFAVARMFQRTEGWPIVTVRPFQVYGPGQPEPALIPAAISAAQGRLPFRMTSGEQKRDFVYIDDLVRGYLLAAAKGIDGHSYDLGWGQSHSLKSVISRLYTIMQARDQPLFGALPYRQGELWDLKADVHAADQELNWRPQVTLDRGLALTYKSHQLDNPGRKL